MSSDSRVPWAGAGRGPRVLRLLRWSAWVLLIGATGYLVRAEVKRPGLPEGVKAFTDIVYRRSGDRRLRLDVYVPTSPAPSSGRPAVLAIHGGGWRGGSKDGYAPHAARLAQQGLVVVAVDYTLSRPGAPSWPENLDDVRAAVRWMRRQHSAYGIDPNRIAALGESAGGHLAALLGTVPAPDPAARVQAVIDFYGPADLATLVVSRPPTADPVALMLGGTLAAVPERYQAASPLRHVTRDTAPMLILHGTDDALVPLDQSAALDSALERAGVRHRLIVVEGARHGFSFRIDDRRDLLPDILAFLRSVWNASLLSRRPHPEYPSPRLADNRGPRLMRAPRRFETCSVDGCALEPRALLSSAMTVERNIVYEDVGGRVETLDLYEPAGPAPSGGRPVILAIHGGGWRRFSKEEYGPKVAAQFVPAGYVVVAMNYQLSAPGAPSWPENIEDVSNAALWVQQHAAALGIDPNRVAALGESAGGHLAALLATDPQPTLPTSSRSTKLVDAVIDFYGPADLTTLAEESPDAGKAAAQYLGGTVAQIPALYQLASPVDHVAAGDPPMLLIHGDDDHLVPIAQSEELTSALTTAGVPNQLISVPGAHHGMEFTPQGEKLLPQILAFLGASWKDEG